MKYKTTITATISIELAEKIDSLAEKSQLSRSKVIEQLIEEAIHETAS